MSPGFSVVIPCRNEANCIEASVRSILAQERPIDGFEVIVADGMSNDGTREILKRLSKDTPMLRIVDNPGLTTPSAINIGIREAQGRYIAIMGAHNRYASDYIIRSIEVIEQTGAANVGGAMICEGRSLIQQGIAAAHHCWFSVGGARWHNPSYEGPVDTVFGGVYRRDVFGRVGMFDEELVRNQDDEFNLRLTRAGGKIWQSSKIKSWYSPRKSLRGLFRQYMQYGYWKVRVVQKHKIPASLRHLIPASFVLLVIILPVISLWRSYVLWAWLGLIGLYLSCSITASFYAASHRRWRLCSILPAVFACLHFGYGLGFLCGIWDFAVLRRRAKRNMFTGITREPVSR